MEYVATALNPAQGPIGGERLWTLVREAPEQEKTRAMLHDRLAAQQWAVYDVRRALSPRSDGKVNVSRSLKKLALGTSDQVRGYLHVLADEHGKPVTVGVPDRPDDAHPRVWLRRREAQAPTTEHFLTIAPAAAVDKVGPGFARAWHQADQQPLFS
jgi:hypothetical protein